MSSTSDKEEIWLRPYEIVDHFPDIAKRFTSSQLGYLVLLDLVRFRRTSRYVLIEVQSILELIKYCSVKKEAA